MLESISLTSDVHESSSKRNGQRQQLTKRAPNSRRTLTYLLTWWWMLVSHWFTADSTHNPDQPRDPIVKEKQRGFHPFTIHPCFSRSLEADPRISSPLCREGRRKGMRAFTTVVSANCRLMTPFCQAASWTSYSSSLSWRCPGGAEISHSSPGFKSFMMLSDRNSFGIQ